MHRMSSWAFTSHLDFWDENVGMHCINEPLLVLDSFIECGKVQMFLEKPLNNLIEVSHYF